jgi:penicillin-binding protein 2
MLRIPIRDHFRETRVFNARLAFIAIVTVVILVLLVARLFYLQVVAHKHYETLSLANRIRPIPIPPPRGLIVDRHGVVLAQNYPVYTLEIVPEQVDDMNTVLEELAGLVRITDGDLRLFRKQMRERPRFEELTLRTHLTDEEAARVAVRRPYLHGVELQARLQRHYPLGGVAVHAVGYVGRINEQEMERIDKNAYRGTQHIGKLGLEAEYEDELLGRVGFERSETNAHGRVLRVLERLAPVAGRNLHLHLDAGLQQIAEQALGKRRGAVVAMNPKTGAVLAFASTPTYDPNPFVRGIDVESYSALRDDLDKPLINRVLNGLYAPGSTIKVFFGLMALETERFDALRPVQCPGWFTIPPNTHVFRDWKKEGHGAVGLQEAIAQSCDVYFYRLANTVGIDTMKSFLDKYGFGQKSGVDIPGESEGIVPSPEWKKARGQPWYPGETVVVGIGQGPITATPLQLLAATAALANGNRRIAPRLADRLEEAGRKSNTLIEPKQLGEIPLDNKAHLTQIIEHMVAAVHSDKGTARRIGWNAPYKIAGKTGTSQVKAIAQGATYKEQLVPERFRDHALFISFAPADDPQVAVTVIVENGGSGSGTAAPIARRVMDYALLGKVIEAGAPAVKVQSEE